jgi:hypothetical protein
VDQSWIARVEDGAIEKPGRERVAALGTLLGAQDAVERFLDADAGDGGMLAGLPAGILGALSAWSPWELQLLEAELPHMQARYREMVKLIQRGVVDIRQPVDADETPTEPVPESGSRDIAELPQARQDRRTKTKEGAPGHGSKKRKSTQASGDKPGVFEEPPGDASELGAP